MNSVIDGVPRSSACTIRLASARALMVFSKPSLATTLTEYSPVLLTVVQAYS